MTNQRPRLFDDPYLLMELMPSKLQYKRIGGLLFVGAEGYWATQVDGFNLSLNADHSSWYWLASYEDQPERFKEQWDFCSSAAEAICHFQANRAEYFKEVA